MKWSEGHINRVSVIIRRYTDHMEFAALRMFLLVYSLIFFFSILYSCICGCVFCVLLFNFVNCIFLLLCYVLLSFVYVFLLLCMFRSVYSVTLCGSVYCLCVTVYCTAANGCQPNCS